MYTKVTLLTVFVFFSGIASFARQNEAGASGGVLERYVAEALAANLTLKQENLAYEQSLQSLAQSKALFMPSAGISATYSLAQGGRKISFPIGDLLNPVYSTLNQLTDSQQFPQVNNEEIQFLPNRFHETKLRVVQPLFNSDIWYGYKAQQQMVTVQQAKRQAYETQLKGMVREAYFSYLQSVEAIRIYESSLNVLDEQVRVTQSFFDAQLVTKDAVYNAQLERSKMDTQLNDARKNEHLARAYFNFLLNKELDAAIEVDSQFSGDFALPQAIVENTGNLTELALQQRNELQQVQQAQEATNYLIKLNEANRIMPNLAVIGDLGYQGFDYQFNGDQQFSMLIFSLQWDLFKGGARKAKYQSAVLQKTTLETQEDQLKKQIELQVIQAYEEARSAANNLSSAEYALKTSESAFKITQSRFQQNQVLPLEFQQSQLNYTNARLSYSIAKYNLLKSVNEVDKVINSL
ncbi:MULTISPECIES: TolC family protein [unclassified Imperialibacter]|uniref:TolC family protein n=1 Tax=unclassified Imperialibacter TaxID=2629706 RepID=UPI0012591699|nr:MULTISPECIES: TolC family protein [unclassified Imperialibacter]CAD5258969.1 Outer membrane protein TolC [Imperialibacter sp. 89]CAD5265903.1 Outer membrane protein TolC [Imperialibacter sp. 75]VVT21277.1 Outer membrane protein TolC [Imperialibacter sp. EC-SDR9]